MRNNAKCHPFRSANWAISKHRVTLADIIRSDKIVWLMVLSNAFVVCGDLRFELNSFDDFDRIQEKHGLPAFKDLRQRGCIVECTRELPSRLIGLLIKFSGGTVDIRTSDSQCRKTVDTDVFVRIVSDGMECDELEAIGSSGNWYLRMRDDDALTFIATGGALAQTIIEDLPGTVRVVDANFIYAA